MTENSAATAIDIGSVSNARELVFSMSNINHRYILQAPGLKEDYLAFISRFQNHDVRRTCLIACGRGGG